MRLSINWVYPVRKFIFFCFQIQAVLGLTNYYVPLKKGKGLNKCKDCKKKYCNKKVFFFRSLNCPTMIAQRPESPGFYLSLALWEKTWKSGMNTGKGKWECASVDSGIRILQSAPEDLWQVTRGTLEPASEVFRRQWNYFQTVKLWDSFERACAEEKSARDSSRSSCR